MSLASCASGARSRYPEAVAVWIFKVALPPGETLFIYGDTELLRDRVDVVDVQVDERVGPCVSFMLGEIEPNASACPRNERWKARQSAAPLIVNVLEGGASVQVSVTLGAQTLQATIVTG